MRQLRVRWSCGVLPHSAVWHLTPKKRQYFCAIKRIKRHEKSLRLEYMSKRISENKSRNFFAETTKMYPKSGDSPCRGRGGTVNQKIRFLITPCNLQKGNPFCAEYMRMVIVYKQGTLGFPTTKRISVRSLFLNNPK